MNDAAATHPQLKDDPEYADNLRRATLASAIGSALEYFDFALYGLSTALIFNVLFFPQGDPAMATVAAFATFGVGFAARPFGGLLFGYLGDKLGRKIILVVTILLMGSASTLIGALPTYETIGIWAPVGLVILRLLQGLGAGAEQAGATVLMAEYSPVKRRGFYAALPFIGIQAGTLLAAFVFFLITLLPEEQMLSWGWRVPFLCSFVLIFLAVFIRSRLKETPTFVELEKSDQVTESPFKELSRNGLPGVFAGIGLRMAENGGSYMFGSLSLAFVLAVAGTEGDRGLLTWGVTIGSLIGMFSVPFAGHLSDKYGRRTIYRAGALFMLLYAFPAWYLLSTANHYVAIAVIALGIGVGVNTMLGPQCAMLPEFFGNRHRYLGVAMARELSAVLAGGLAGVLGAYLMAVSGNNWIIMGVYLATISAITFGTTFLVPETRGRDLTRLDDAVKVSTHESGDSDVSYAVAMVESGQSDLFVATNTGISRAITEAEVYGQGFDNEQAGRERP
ncbi:MAG: MFS transporter [Dermabacter sp.]|nr:MFS transporter [Dermabacter sp.]